jgi:ferredoxin
MPVISILPHAALCPDGARFEAPQGSILCRALLDHGIRIEHACDMSCACTTCHVIVREGLSSLVTATDDEDDIGTSCMFCASFIFLYSICVSLIRSYLIWYYLVFPSISYFICICAAILVWYFSLLLFSV